jgi:hypothetical protein
MLSSQGSLKMANWQSVRYRLDAEKKREARNQNRFRERVESARPKAPRITEGGDFEGSVFRCKSGQRFPKIRLSAVIMPIISPAVTKTAPIQPTADAKPLPTRKPGPWAFACGPASRIGPVPIAI